MPLHGRATSRIEFEPTNGRDDGQHRSRIRLVFASRHSRTPKRVEAGSRWPSAGQVGVSLVPANELIASS